MKWSPENQDASHIMNTFAGERNAYRTNTLSETDPQANIWYSTLSSHERSSPGVVRYNDQVGSIDKNRAKVPCPECGQLLKDENSVRFVPIFYNFVF